jgi:hypothetical protein
MPYPSVQGENRHGEWPSHISTIYLLLLNCHVQLDAGLHAGYSGMAALPFYDDFDLSTVDVLLISQ